MRMLAKTPTPKTTQVAQWVFGWRDIKEKTAQNKAHPKKKYAVFSEKSTQIADKIEKQTEIKGWKGRNFPSPFSFLPTWESS